MMNNKEKQTNHNHYRITENNGEIPFLSLKVVRSVAEFTTDHIDICARGWNINECILGINYLLERIKDINLGQEVKK